MKNHKIHIDNRMSNTMKKHKKTKEVDELGNSIITLEDLPDEIIVDQDAVATSVLSRRWRYLWRFTRLKSLNFEFDICDKYGMDNLLGILLYIEKKRQSFVDWVNTVVNQHLGHHEIESFRVCHYLLDEHRHDIKKWIKFAMRNKSLERLELDFSVHTMNRKTHEYYRGFRQHFSVGFFKSLRVIALNCVSVSGEDVEYLLSTAPLLERLAVHDSPNLVRLTVSGQSLALKYLEIVRCENLASLKICQVNIVSLRFEAPIYSKYILRDVPLLVELHISEFVDFAKLVKFSPCVSHQIEFLSIVECIEDDDDDEYFYGGYPELPNVVKHLRLTLTCGSCLDPFYNYSDEYGGFINLRIIMEAFPNLERLVLHAPRYYIYACEDHRRPFEPARDPKFPHKCLKEVEVVEYSGKFGDMDRVLYLVRNIVALEKIVVNCKYHHRKRLFTTKQQIIDHEEFSRIHALTQLKPQLPPNIQFVCL